MSFQELILIKSQVGSYVMICIHTVHFTVKIIYDCLQYFDSFEYIRSVQVTILRYTVDDLLLLFLSTKFEVYCTLCWPIYLHILIILDVDLEWLSLMLKQVTKKKVQFCNETKITFKWIYFDRSASQVLLLLLFFLHWRTYIHHFDMWLEIVTCNLAKKWWLLVSKDKIHPIILQLHLRRWLLLWSYGSLFFLSFFTFIPYCMEYGDYITWFK